MKFYLGLLVLLVVSCTPVHEEEVELQAINWKGVRQCLQDASSLIPEIQELIQLIKDKQFGKALTLGINLIRKGIKIVKDCINRFKTKNLSAIPPKKEKPAHFDFCEMHYRKTHKNATIEEIHNAPEYKECREKVEKHRQERKEKREECFKKCEEKKTPFEQNICKLKCKKFRPVRPVKPETEPNLEIVVPTTIPIIPKPTPTFPLPIPVPRPFPRPVKQ